jgi:predicted Zn-dependent protease
VFGSLARAMLALAKGDGAAADVAVAEARKAAPDSTSVEILLGAAHAAAGRDREAVDVWRDAIGTLAADPDWSLPLAEALGRTGDYAGALEALSLLPRDPSRVESVRAIDAAIALGRYDQARAAAEKGRTGTGAYQSRLAFYALVFAYADALAPNATEATKRSFISSGEAFVKTGAELAPLVQSWIDSLGS